MRTRVGLALVLLAATVAAALDLTTCGAVVARGQTGVLRNDLLCAGEFAGVSLESGATLDLNGYAIRGPAVKGVYCSGRCRVVSRVPGGEITGTITGIFNWTTLPLTVRDVTVRDLDPATPDFGIEAPAAKVDLQRVTVRRAGNIGIIARRAFLREVDASEQLDIGVYGIDLVRAWHLVTDDNGTWGVVTAGRLAAADLLARGNGMGGIRIVRGRVLGGTITGNHPPLGLDVWAFERPRLVGVVCARSQLIEAPIGTDLDVCADD